jgi:hypothetical protein
MSAVGRRDASQARTPSTPTVVPMASEAAISTACTHRNAVGDPLWNDRSSSQMASPNRGQMTQVHTPTPTRNAAHRREMITGPVCARYRGSFAAIRAKASFTSAADGAAPGRTLGGCSSWS